MMPVIVLLLGVFVVCGCVWYLIYGRPEWPQKVAPAPAPAAPKPPPDTKLLVDVKLSEGVIGFRFTEDGRPMYLTSFNITPLVARCTAYLLLTAADTIDRRSSKMVVDGVEQHFSLEAK